jgi:hypothetical protein
LCWIARPEKTNVRGCLAAGFESWPFEMVAPMTSIRTRYTNKKRVRDNVRKHDLIVFDSKTAKTLMKITIKVFAAENENTY